MARLGVNIVAMSGLQGEQERKKHIRAECCFWPRGGGNRSGFLNEAYVERWRLK